MGPRSNSKKRNSGIHYLCAQNALPPSHLHFCVFTRCRFVHESVRTNFGILGPDGADCIYKANVPLRWCQHGVGHIYSSMSESSETCMYKTCGANWASLDSSGLLLIHQQKLRFRGHLQTLPVLRGSGCIECPLHTKGVLELTEKVVPKLHRQIHLDLRVVSHRSVPIPLHSVRFGATELYVKARWSGRLILAEPVGQHDRPFWKRQLAVHHLGLLGIGKVHRLPCCTKHLLVPCNLLQRSLRHEVRAQPARHLAVTLGGICLGTCSFSGPGDGHVQLGPQHLRSIGSITTLHIYFEGGALLR
mmetsp:Transcript_9445/g.14521  ORF Transcript_9445/g.14521 Transcript_9445/m.14521 type:complete len:303 (+) Transcript_9445:891-1799(+)